MAEGEGADREYEALERPIVHPVPNARRGDGLLLVDPHHELDVEAPEVDRLAGGVDFGLIRSLGLVEHGCGVEGRAPWAGEELGRAQEDGGPFFPGRARPVVPGLAGRLDRTLDLVRAALVDVCEHVLLAVRHDCLERSARPHVLAPDHARDLDPLGLHLVQAALDLVTFRATRGVGADRLVVGRRGAEDAVRAHGAIVDWGGGCDATGVRGRGVGDRRAVGCGGTTGVARTASAAARAAGATPCLLPLSA